MVPWRRYPTKPGDCRDRFRAAIMTTDDAKSANPGTPGNAGGTSFGNCNFSGKPILGRCGNNVLELHFGLIEQLPVPPGRLPPFVLAGLA